VVAQSDNNILILKKYEKRWYIIHTISGAEKRIKQMIFDQSSAVVPKLCVATPWGGAEFRQGRRQKTMEKTEKSKNSDLLLLNSNSNHSFPLTNFLTYNFNSSDCIFYYYNYSLLTVYFSKIYNF
jgi:hypothetical protein